MRMKRSARPYWEMTTQELAAATQEFDLEFSADQAKPLTPGRRARWTRAMAKRDLNRRNGSTMLERLLEPVSRSLNVEAARKLIRVKADAKTQARVDELARKRNEGDLTPAECLEYERYVTAGTMIAILQAKARLLLAKNS